MMPLHIGYSISGFVTGLVLLFTFLTTLPDGKLHIVFCDVGQGDAVYVRFPDGRDALIDGGPNDKVISCLSRHMPFWDRSLDLVFLTHPEHDHYAGLISVLERFAVGNMIETGVPAASGGYEKLREVLTSRGVAVRRVAAGDRIEVESVALDVIWPTVDQLARAKPYDNSQDAPVLGARTGNPNDSSLVLWLRYDKFDVWLPGDADTDTESGYMDMSLADDPIDVLKVPHHGSRTGMSQSLMDKLRPKLAVISVGKNSYGHPAAETLSMLADIGSRVLRTDQNGTIEVITDGEEWGVR